MQDTTEAPQQTVNVPMLRRVIAQITTHPETHNQEVFEDCDFDDAGNLCKTAFCVAGWAAYFDGWRPRQLTSVWDHKDGSSTDSVGLLAEEILCITGDQAWGADYGQGLFASEKSLEQVIEIAMVIAAEAGEVL